MGGKSPIHGIIKFRNDIGYKRRWDRKIIKMLDGKNGQLTGEMESQISQVWAKYAKVNPNWAKWYYLCNGQFSPYYIPSDIYFARICRVLNSKNRFSYPLLQDKNYLNLLFADVRKTNTIIHCINGQLLDSCYRPVTSENAKSICVQSGSELVIKPSIDSTEARNVDFIRPTDDTIEKLTILMDSHGTDYVIQKALVQHPGMAKLNPDSINTIRVLSLLRNGEIVILGSLVRIGVKGVRVDNLVASNGVSCCINLDTGTFNQRAFDRAGNAYEALPNGLTLEGYHIPGFNKVITLVKELHYRLAHFKLIGWDFTVDEDENPVLIETNLDFPELDFHQIGTGPLFGESILFREIMDYVYSQKNYLWFKEGLY